MTVIPKIKDITNEASEYCRKSILKEVIKLIMKKRNGLETIECAALTFQGVDDIQGGHGLAPRMLGVSNGLADDVFQEVAQHTADLLVDIAADALDTTPASETTDRRLRNALDIFPHDLAMSLGATLTKTFATFAATRYWK
jgi:hypothetical protein